MKFLDTLLARWFPRATLRGLQARAAVSAYYDAARPSRTHKQNKSPGSPDAEGAPAIVSLREQARYMEQNYDVAKGALDVLVDGVVGLGITPTFQLKTFTGDLATEANAALKKHYKNWSRYPEVTHEHSISSVQRLACRTWCRDGEMLAQRVKGTSRSLDHGTTVPYSIEPMEPDYLPAIHDDVKDGVVQGVKKNAWGRPVAYFVFKEHPGDSYWQTANALQLKRIPADRMIHLKMVTRFKQTRGISVFASVLNRIDDIKEIEESERVAGRMAAAMAAVITKGSPDLYIADGEGTSTEPREMDFAPGMTFDGLMPGESVEMLKNERPNTALIPFLADNKRALASGFGTSYSSIAKDYSGTYSSQRQELVESRVHYGVMWQEFVEKFCQPIVEDFLTAAVDAGLLDGLDYDPDTLYDVTHSRPAMPWIDPQKEMNGIEKEVQLGIASVAEVIQRRGGDPEEVALQVVKERREKSKLEQELAPVVEPVQNTSQSQPEEDEDADPKSE